MIHLEFNPINTPAIYIIKLLLTSFLIGFSSICFSQNLDTLEYDVGKINGFQRIREINSKGDLVACWFTQWLEDGVVEKNFTKYNDRDVIVTSVDSTFNKYNNLIKLRRKIADSIEGDSQEFSNDGALVSRDVSLFLEGKYVIFQKYLDNTGWTYRSIIDGYPPDYIPINEELFEQAVKTYNDKLFVSKIKN